MSVVIGYEFLLLRMSRRLFAMTRKFPAVLPVPGSASNLLSGQSTSVIHLHYHVRRLGFLFCLILFGLQAHAKTPGPENVAFYYGREAPIGALFAYDWVVLQKDQATDARIDLLHRGGTLPVAYLSIGEIARSHRYVKEVRESWILGENEAWQSVVLDIRLPEVREFLLDRLVVPAMKRGFGGVFLDTMDSHLLTEEGRSGSDDFAESQAVLLETLRARYPQAKIIINRGFHLPESSHSLVDALAFESWRSGYDASRDRYTEVSESDRAWLSGQLAQWRERRPDLPLIAIDYAEDGEAAEPLAAQLRAEGFIPYVSDGALNRLGPASPAVVKRHVLVVHDQPTSEMDRSAAHRRLGIILERLGLVPVYHSALEPIPAEPLGDRYLGVVMWWETGDRNPAFCQWLSEWQSATLPMVTFGLPPAQSACQQLMNSRRLAMPAVPLNFNALQATVTGYEGGQLPGAPSSPLPSMDSGEAWITATDRDGSVFHPVYTFDRGGAAIAPFVLDRGPADQAFWLFDPFRFLVEALGLGTIPAADSTTESGRRIVTAHIDGDGLVSRAELPGSPLSAEVIAARILARYRIPHTVSVIEAETAPAGLHPETSEAAEAISRRMFGMSHTEVASHTYTHPFFWRIMEGGRGPDQGSTLYGYSLNILGYTADLEREIAGSVDYINRRLTAEDKPVSVFLWTGDARPGAGALAMVRELGLINVNGGDTRPLPYDSELAGVWPDARPVGDELQVYAPVMNENVYTNLWTGPFYGFRNVIDTFRILEEKGRLKPMGIYYHFYSGTKPESLAALDEIYQYALRQSVTPLFLSDYARRVQAQYYSALTVNQEGGFQWRGLETPTTVRVDTSQYPDLELSKGVAGYRDVGDLRFVHLAGPGAILHLSQSPVRGPYLESTNAKITDWRRERVEGAWRLRAELSGHQPIEVIVAGATQCTNRSRPVMTQVRGPNTLAFRTAVDQTVSLDLECR